MSLLEIATSLALQTATIPNRVGERPFSVASNADGFPIHGQVDAPTGKPRAMVVFLPGSGNHSRDFEYAPRGSPLRTYVFEDLARAFSAAGLATTRYDERGVSCVGKPPPSDGRRRCRDDAASRKINWTTLHGDALAVVQHAASQPGGRCLILLGHSEGFAHAIRLTERGDANPAGLIGVGGLMDSLASAIFFQRVNSVPDSIAQSDLDRDGNVTRSEFAKNLLNTPAGRFADVARVPFPEGWQWPEGGLSLSAIDELRRLNRKQYDKMRAEALVESDDAPVFTTGRDGVRAVSASAAWFKPFLTDWMPEARRLSSYVGPIRLFLGDRDGNLDAAGQVEAARIHLGGADLKVTLTPGVGHILGSDASFGPMRADQQALVVGAAARIADHCASLKQER